ncbi:MAG: InlB B-repeat-containing protein, partial [Treponema sp.]|nr:InlB B-repeat-containing protein [Treponema sp.]
MVDTVSEPFTSVTFTDGAKTIRITISGGATTATVTEGGVTRTYTVDSSGGTSAVKRTVTFSTNGGSSVASQSVDDGSCAVKPADPARTGYTFAGWYSDSGLTTEYGFASAVSADLTLYAKWTGNTYKVTFNANGGSGTMAAQAFT